MNSHVIQGTPDRLTYLRSVASRSARIRDWTVPKHTKPGDRVIFYLVGPLSAFVATGIVVGSTWQNNDRKDSWFGYYMAPIGKLEMFARPVSLDTVRRSLPEWKYLKSVQGTVTVPGSLAGRLIRCLKNLEISDGAALVDMEGIQTETRVPGTQAQRAFAR